MQNLILAQYCIKLNIWLLLKTLRPLLPTQEFHERLHSLLLWLAHAESRRYAADISDPATPATDLRQHLSTLTVSRWNPGCSTKRCGTSRVPPLGRLRRHLLHLLWFVGSAERAAGQADSAGLPPGSVESAAAWGRGGGGRRGRGEAPRDQQQAQVAAEGGGAGPRRSSAASGESLTLNRQSS